ncbi:hypothetical protein [Phaeobacter sp. C3_T13_0]|uniref:hypothetical protein n=1 Tax=Phaeobacter cretensis TaxID=3342641 RepID=UPI0039BD52DF
MIQKKPETVDATQGRIGESAWATARNGSRLDTEMAAQLRMVLSESFRTARSWLDLIRALRSKGFYLQQSEGRIRLRDAHSHIEICTCRFLGFPGAELEARFGTPLPDNLRQA